MKQMWQVTNKSNTKTLFYYNKHVINNFWKFCIILAGVRNVRTKIDQNDFLENYIASKGGFDPRFFRLTKSGKVSFRSLTILIVKLGVRVLKKEYDIYLGQNRNVYRLNYDFDPVEHPLALKNIFKDYFYDVCWAKAWIWDELVGISFDRSIFQQNFKIENKMSICPYCDLTTIPSKRSAWVEHFLPKNKFPYVANNPKNLIPTCTPCNVSGTGKGEEHQNPIIGPLQEQIGDRLTFRLKNGKIEIDIVDEVRIENYLTLLKSRKRFSELNVERSIFNTLISTYELIIGGNKAQELDQTFLNYIKAIGKEQGHYFARKTLLQDIELIKNI